MLLCAVAIMVMSLCNTMVKAQGTMKDQDGNTYKTVKIGQQEWMAENMRATHDREGKAIAMGSEESYDTPYRYCPDSNSANVKEYGYLYNWAAAMKVCPQGWHLPTDAEWTQLTDYLENNGYYCGSSNDNTGKALASKTGWESSSGQCDVGNDSRTNNATGFSALPAGSYYGGNYDNFGHNAAFWSATEDYGDDAWYRYLYYSTAYVYRGNGYKYNGRSVRCVRD